MEEQNTPLIFGDWLKRRRKALDMTQDELALRAGCSVGALRKIESGDRRPSKQLADLLAQALEIPAEDKNTFIRVARGDLNLLRLEAPLLVPSEPVPGIEDLRQFNQREHLISAQSSSLPVNRIPLQATPLIGREPEFAALERLFSDPQCRLLTLTGIGGIGKTSLAIEFGIKKQASFPGGVIYVPLASVNSSEKVIPAIADILDFGFSGPTDPKEQLLIFLSNQINNEALFIFDNLEHLLSRGLVNEDKYGVVELISEILRRLPNVKILGTSRERLNLHGEWTYELHGLSVPPTAYVGKLEEYNSVELFVRSAQRIRADFQATEDEHKYLIQITQMVEGVPLAIELAAAWVGILSCQEIAQEIKANMDFLTTSMRDIPERHRSIRATFDHSWKLLSDEERQVLSQLSVYQGGFDRNAAHQIAGASLPLLASLNAKSLIRLAQTGRYDLHEVIRQYTSAHLNKHPQCGETYERHCSYYLDFAHDREQALKRSTQQEAVRQMMDEIDNIRAAWLWGIKHKQFDKLERAGRAFGWYFEITGLYQEGIDQLELLVSALINEPHNNQWHRMMGLSLVHQAVLNFRSGLFDQARKQYEDSITLLKPTGDQILLADAYIYLGIINHLFGDYENAKSLVEQGLDFARNSRASWYEAYAIYNLGYIESLKGNYAVGYEQMMDGLAIWRTLGDPHYISLGLNFLVSTLLKLGRVGEAIAFMEESIAICEQSKNRWGMGTAYRFLGLAYLADGQYTKAQTQLLKSLEIYVGFTIGYDISRSLAYLGDASLYAGDLSEARIYYLDALRLSIEEKIVPISLDILAGLSSIEAQTGETENALMWCYMVLGHPSSEDETRVRVRELSEVLTIKLDSQQITDIRAEAESCSVDDLLQEILESASV